MERRRPGRRRRHAVLLGCASTQFNDATRSRPRRGHHRRGRRGRRAIVVGPTAPRSRRLDAEAYARRDFDPETGALLEGFTYKESAGVAFDAIERGVEAGHPAPVISEDGLAMTLTYDSFYVDYQFSPPTRPRPAHVVAARALGIEDPAAAKQASSMRSRTTTPAALKPIAEFWNTGFDTDPLPDDPGLYLSHGAYILTGYTQRTEMTFEAREDYAWGPQTAAPDDRLQDHRRPGRRGAGDGERRGRHHPAAVDERPARPARGSCRSRHRVVDRTTRRRTSTSTSP